MPNAQTAPPADNTPAEQSPTVDDGKGGKSAVLADLATERDKRQALEQQVNQLLEAQKTQATALAQAFGLKPEEATDVSRLAASVTALQQQFEQSQRTNLVLSVANEHGITDKDAIEDLQAVTDEQAMRRLAGRLKAAQAPLQPGTPRPDLSQGGRQETEAATPAADFEQFIKQQLGR